MLWKSVLREYQHFESAVRAAYRWRRMHLPSQVIRVCFGWPATAPPPNRCERRSSENPQFLGKLDVMWRRFSLCTAPSMKKHVGVEVWTPCRDLAISPGTFDENNPENLVRACTPRKKLPAPGS